MKNPIKEFNKIQKNNTEKRCANQRSELFNLNNKILQQKYEIEQQQAEINRLREALKSVKQQTINLGDYEELGAIATISDICNKALNGKSEGEND